MTDIKTLPPSLAVTPNIPCERQSLDQLKQELAYWEACIAEATCWGAGLVAADGFRKSCTAWIRRREAENT